MSYLRIIWTVAAVLVLLLTRSAEAEDWPMWRYDAYRSAASPEELPSEMNLKWTRQYSQRVQVWDDPLNHDLMAYDKIFEPVVMGERMFVAFNDSDKLVALNIRTGAELWDYYTDGPVRFPPVAWEGKVYVCSDDGRLHCLDAGDGSLKWSYRGGPSELKVLGNRRVISAWPARGGPVLRDGKVYFAASIWPFMGTFIYALEAETGRVVWVNDGGGSRFLKQPHGAGSFAGVAPQGALVATSEILLVPGGRSIPAAFDRETGKFLHFELNDGGKGNGGSFVIANESHSFVHTRLRGVRSFSLKSGKKGRMVLNEPVLAGETLYSADAFGVLGRKVARAEEAVRLALTTEDDLREEWEEASFDQDKDRMKKTQKDYEKAVKKTQSAEKALVKAEAALTNVVESSVIQASDTDGDIKWELPADGLGDIIKAGHRLYAAGSNRVFAVELPREEDGLPELGWSRSVQGKVSRLLAANGMLFAVTLEGGILAFGSGAEETAVTLPKRVPLAESSRGPARLARAILDQAGTQEGYAFCFGVDDGLLLQSLVLNSKLQIAAVDPDPSKVDQLRRRFDAAGLYGTRVALHQNAPVAFKAPPYVANLIVVGRSFAPELEDFQVLRAVFESVRPYGGLLWITADTSQQRTLARVIERANLPQARIQPGQGGLSVFRDGPLPGAADWTHQYGDIANTVKSDDLRVKAPLGLLWFGGSSNMDVLPRHGHGPPEQVVGGRTFIEGMNSLSARDVYTGRSLWKREFEDLGTFSIYYNSSYTNTPLSIAYNQRHIPGANARGANFVVTAEAVYLAVSNRCEVFDPATGRTIRSIPLPGDPHGRLQWGFIGVYEDVLLGGTGFANFRERYIVAPGRLKAGIEDYSASGGLAAFDRHTGRVLWQLEARHSFIHNGIVAGQGRVYVLDKLPKSAEGKRKRRGLNVPDGYRIAALDYKTGNILWQTEKDTFGTWLGYSEEHDLLLQAGASARDRLKDEVGEGMITYRGQDGSVQWQDLKRKYTGPCILHNDIIITTPESDKVSSGAFNLLDGSPHLITNPLTGQLEPWRITRAYGCNTIIASEHLLTFRSGAAGYYDLETRSGTGNLGGFKSSCTSNLIIADGVLNAPDYTRTCTCAYQNQTSLALIHMPEIEMWTYSKFGYDAKDGEPIRSVGINFGAPGDRRAEDGVLWLDYPSVGGESPDLPITLKGEDHSFFRRHTSQIWGQGLAWVAASGVEGIESISITPEILKPKKKPTSSRGRGRGRKPAPKEEDDDDDKDVEEESTDSKADSASADKKDTDDEDAKKKEEEARKAKKAEEEAAAHEREKAEARRLRPPVPYTVRLYFAEPGDFNVGQRVFGVTLQGEPVLENFDIVRETGGKQLSLVKEFRGVVIQEHLVVGLAANTNSLGAPLVCGIELQAEDQTAGK